MKTIWQAVFLVVFPVQILLALYFFSEMKRPVSGASAFVALLFDLVCMLVTVLIFGGIYLW